MNTKLFFSILRFTFFIIFLLAAEDSNGQIASWTYEPLLGATATPTPNTGAGTSLIVPGATQTPGTATGMDPVINSGCGAQNGTAAGAWQFTSFDPGSATETNGVQYKVSTVGFGNITFAWDMRFSNTAPNTVRLQYTINGSTWTNFVMTSANTTVCAGSSIVGGCFRTNFGDEYRRVTIDLSAITTANNNANFGVRILAAHDPSYGQFRQATTPTSLATNSGTWRIDNVKVGGTAGTGPTNTVFNPSGTTAICDGASTNLRFVVTGGTGPFTLVYRDNFLNTNVTLTNYVSGTNIPVSPTNNTTYSLVSIANANGIPGVVSGASTRTVNINPLPVLPAPYILADISDCTAATPYPSTAGIANFPIAGTNQPSAGYTTTYTGISFPYSGGSTTFTVSIRNNTSLCIWTSPTYNFTRYASPAIITAPSVADQSTCSGIAFSPITVSATGSNLSYQWYSNDGATTTILNTASDIASGSQSASYTPQSGVLGTLKYYVRISGYCSPAVNSAYSGNYTVNAAAIAGTVSGVQTICMGSVPADLVLSGQTGSVIKWQRADDVSFTMGVADISSTSPILTGTNIGPITQTAYFIAFVQLGGCTVTTVPVEVLVKTVTYSAGAWSNVIGPDSTMTAIFNGNYSSVGNLNACSVTVLSGNVTINSNHTLTIENGLTVSGGSLTFEDKASLVQINNTTNSGDIIYKRNSQPMRKFDYTYWSSPVELQIMANLFTEPTLSDKYFWLNTTTYAWEQIAVPSLTPMDIGKGYIIRAPLTNDPVTASIVQATFTGVPNNGNYNVDIVKTGANDLNCIGNPYPSAISADAFILQNAAAFTHPVSGTVGSTFYFWTHNTPITNNAYTFSDYAAYNFSGGIGTGTAASGINNTPPNGMIAAGQAFMMKGIIEGTTSAGFNNTMRQVGNNDRFFRQQASMDNLEKNRIWLELKGSQGASKQILAGYIANATDTFDNGYDGEVLETANTVSFYSVLDNKKLAIQGRSLPFHNDDQIELGFQTNNSGNYEISLSNFDGLFYEQEIYLEDQFLHTIHNLKETTYSFAAEAGTFDSRFVLRFQSSNLAIINPVLNSNAIVIYKNQQEISINSDPLKMEEVKIFDSLGRLLLTKINIDAVDIKVSPLTAKQVLFFEVKLVGGQVVTKKYLN